MITKNYTTQEQKFLKHIGSNIKKYREQQELSQEDMALQAELDRTYISGIERGNRNISIITLRKIAHALNIEIGKLVNGQNHK